MQWARSAYSFFDRTYKQSHPFFSLKPVFKGQAALSTGRLPLAGSPQLEPTFQLLEESLFVKGMQKAESTRKAIDREVTRRAARLGNEKE